MSDSATGPLGGNLRSLGANQPFLMTEAGKMFHVRQGGLDIFWVELQGRRVVGRRRFVTRVPSGKMAFGCAPLPDPDSEGGTVGLLAVPALDTVIVETTRDRLNATDFSLSDVIWLDDWVSALGAFMVGDLVPPRDTQRLEADPDIPSAAGSRVSAYHGDTIWICATGPLRLLGDAELTIEPGDPLIPVSSRIWLEVAEDAEITATRTPAVILAERQWSALDRFSGLALRHSIAARRRGYAEFDRRKADSHEARREATARSLHTLRGVLDRPDRRAFQASAGRTPLQRAVTLVADAVGVTLDIPPNQADPPDPTEAVITLGQRCGFHSRQITLERGWWKRDGPPFLGFGADGRPLAVLTGGRSRYRSIDVTTGDATPVGRETAQQIRRTGHLLYGGLPEGLRTGAGALRFGLQGRGRDLRVVILMAALTGLVSLVSPLLMGKLLVEVIPRVDVPMWTALLGALVAAAASAAVFGIVRALAMLRIEGRVDERLQSAVWARLISLPTSFFRGRTAGDIADRANGISFIRQLMTGATAQALIGGVSAVFTFALLFYYSWSLALTAGGLLLLLSGSSWFFASAQMRHHRNAFNIQGKIDGFIFQMLSGISKLRTANATSYAIAHWADRYAEQKQETLAARQWSSAQFALNSTFAPLAALGLFAFIYYRLIEAQPTPTFGLADFLSFNAAFGQLVVAVTGLTSALTTAVAALPLFERVEPILQAEPELRERGSDPGEVTGQVDLVGVSFRYAPGAPRAVSDISLSIAPGDYVAFVGASGSGKSTLLRLLLGFERPDTGAVLLNGQDVSGVNMAVARRRMGVVLQHSLLVAGSIFDNIAGSTALTMEEAWAAARAAGLEADIRSMPMGMHTVLPEGAAGLSAGQKQRLLIARALSHQPRLVLFDEATSALDNRAQATVQRALKELSVTRIVIAHRLSTIRDADRIHVLDEGRIVEEGSYQELMDRQGVFAALARRQTV